MKAAMNGWVQRIDLILPTLQDNTADTDRLTGSLKTALNTSSVSLDLNLTRKIPSLIRKFNYKITCILFRDGNRWILIDIRPHDLSDPVLGIAVDLHRNLAKSVTVG